MTHKLAPAAVAVCLAFVWACGQSNEPTARAPAKEIASEQFKDFGEYVVHYNAFTSDQLEAQIARSYGIARSTNRVVMVISIRKKREGEPGDVSADGKVTGQIVNLTGQLKSDSVREIDDGGVTYYIGETTVIDGETLVFDVSVTPTDTNRVLPVKFQRQFFTG